MNSCRGGRSTILPCSSPLRTQEIVFKTMPSFLGCHLLVCSENFSVTLWSLLLVFEVRSQPQWGLVEGRLWVSVNGWWCINGAILLMGIHKGPQIRVTPSFVPLDIRSANTFQALVSRIILGTLWSGKEAKGMVLASKICS